VVGLLFHNVTGNFAVATASAIGGVAFCLLIQISFPTGAQATRQNEPADRSATGA
jgi:hypothetical protein